MRFLTTFIVIILASVVIFIALPHKATNTISPTPTYTDIATLPQSSPTTLSSTIPITSPLVVATKKPSPQPTQSGAHGDVSSTTTDHVYNNSTSEKQYVTSSHPAAQISLVFTPRVASGQLANKEAVKTTTDAKGLFSINLNPGSYNVSSTSHITEQDFIVRPNESTVLHLVIQRLNP